ncbi:glycosyltransferase family 4 protein [Arenimonas daejeonensis]|uniref:glycosyltransferase family 4 protein n=1 Tax=Arenimonas daejeonensis TaxID=370777 RepID=UPI0011BED5DF|nr:glycosyltransferase family 4 protein [Arenimonas daejeonensis]
MKIAKIIFGAGPREGPLKRIAKILFGAGPDGDIVVDHPVIPGAYYTIRAHAHDDASSAGPTGMMARVRFLDAAGVEIPGVAAGCSTSEQYGAFVYLPTVVPGAEPAWAQAPVCAPERAAKMRLSVRRWKVSAALAFSGRVDIADDRTFAKFEQTHPVDAGRAYQLTVRLADDEPTDRAMVLTMEFQDAAGQRLPGPYVGTSESPRFGAYRYAGAAAQDGSLNVFGLSAPEQAAQLVIRGHRWHGGSGLQLVAPISLVAQGVTDTTRWKLVDAAGDEMDQCLAPEHAGLVCVQLGYQADVEPKEIAALVTLRFLDAAGQPMVAGIDSPEAALSAPITLMGSPSAMVRKCLAWRPAGAVGLRVKVQPAATESMVRIDPTPGVETLSPDLPGVRIETVAAPMQRSEHSVRMFSAWSSRVRVEVLRPFDPSLPEPELYLFFGDDRGKTVPPQDGLIDSADVEYRTFGNILRLFLRRKAHADVDTCPGLEVFTAQFSLRAPIGATNAVLRMGNRSLSAEAAMGLDVQTTYDLIESAITPAMAGDLALLEDASPEAGRFALQRLLELHGDDHGVMMAAMDSFRRLGDVDRLEAMAARGVSVQGAAAGKLRMKSKHMLALVRELDTNWLPDVGGIPPLAPAPRPASAGLRVAHLFKTTLPHENSGGAIRCLNIVKHQQRIGMRPIAITPLGYPERGLSGAPWERDDVEGIPHFRLNGLSRADVRSVPVTRQLDFTALLTAQLLRSEGVDLIQASSGYRGYEQALVGLAVARRLGVPFVYEVRSYHEHTWRPMAEWVMDKQMTRRRMAQEDRCMREADAVVTICETMKEGLVARGIPADKVFVVPNSVDMEHFIPQAPDLALREQLGIKAGTVAGYISNLSAREGHAVLLRGVAMARARGADLACLIVGAGPELERLKALAGQLGIAEHVVFTGEVAHDQVQKYYALIDLFVVPRVEDFASDYVTPMKPFEAMAMGRPVIISDRPALKEVVEPGVRGDVFRAGDAEHLADKLVALQAQPSIAHEFALAGREWITNERTWEKSIRIYEAVYAYARATRDVAV